MGDRLALHEALCSILKTRNVYFQPPESIKLSYPCIVYSISSVDKRNANNAMYKSAVEYEVTIIDPDPDSKLPIKVMHYFPMCRFNRSFTSDNLNHSVVTLYY